MQRGPRQITVNKFDFKTRKTDKILEGVTGFVLSNNGEKMLLPAEAQWLIAPRRNEALRQAWRRPTQA